MLKLCRSLCLMVLIFSACNGRTYSSAAESPEALMNNWVGTWKIELSLKKSALIPEAMTLKGTETRQWILNKQFFQIRQTYAGGAFQKLSLVRYEPNQDIFLFWDFDSKGGFPMGITRGKWDQDKSEIAISGEYLGGATAEGVIRLEDDDHAEMNLTVTSADGTVLIDLEVMADRSN